MRCVVELSRSPNWSRLALVAAITLGAAGCSSDYSRMSDNGSASSGARPSAEITGSIPSNSAPPINSTSLPPPQSAQPAPLATLVTPAPEYRIATTTPTKPAAGSPATPPVKSLPTHLVVPGDTLHKIARQYHVSVADLASANKIAPNSKLKLGNQLVIPAQLTLQANVPPPKMAAKPKPNLNPPASNAHKITPTPDVTAENKGVAGAASLSFRWPVRGRIISGFGPKPSGQENAGINFAVPEGTPVKAAEDGVVVYASNELKTYGNLVLVRHANGFVTAYAHASEILVKRDDPVKRGQVIAKSGQTGNVSAPQLHFEIRKGATPIDPMPFLDRGPPA